MIVETSNSFLEYADHIIYVRLKEGKEITIESMKEQYKAQEELVKNDKYAVLVDGRNTVIMPPETRKFMAAHQPVNRKATALVSNNNLVTVLIGNFYLKVNKPKLQTRLFKQEEEAVKWLKKQLGNY
jgi:hypothetical protein